MNKLFILLGILPLVLLSVNTFGQQDPLFTQYMNNPVSINPAYAGSRATMNVIALHRQQWVGIDGAPKTLSLSINSPFKSYHVGLGLSLIHDVIGPVTQTGVYADYAYHLKVSDRSKLSMGIKGGFNFYDYNLFSLVGAANDDQVALNGKNTLFLPNFGMGVYWYSDRGYLGLSSPKILRNSLVENENTLTFTAKEERHLFVMGGLVADLSEYIKFKPSFSSRLVTGSPVSAEATAAFIFYEKLMLGAMYRLGDSMGGIVQFQLSPQLMIGYAYDMTHSRLRQYNDGTHEIVISYDFKFGNRKILSPRFF